MGGVRGLEKEATQAGREETVSLRRARASFSPPGKEAEPEPPEGRTLAREEREGMEERRGASGEKKGGKEEEERKRG